MKVMSGSRFAFNGVGTQMMTASAAASFEKSVLYSNFFVSFAFAMRSLTATGTRAGDGTGAGDGIGAAPVLLPNLGGSLPNDVFTDTLGLPTVWIPHSYPACAQHAPDEHLLGSLARESLRLMTGLFWDLGETGGPVRGATGRSA